MKKILLLLFCFLIMPSAIAIQVTGESLLDLSPEFYNNDFYIKILKTETFESGLRFEEGSTLRFKIKDYIAPKRAKQDGYFVLTPVSIEKDDVIESLADKNLEAKIGGFKAVSKSELKKGVVKNGLTAGVEVGLKATGNSIPLVGQALAATKGIVKPNEGETRLESAAENVYESTPISYIRKGSNLSISKGEQVTVQIYHADIPKWKPVKRHK